MKSKQFCAVHDTICAVLKDENLCSPKIRKIDIRKFTRITIFSCPPLLQEVAQLSQRDRATHELLRFAKLRSGIFEPPFGGLGRKVGALSIPRWETPDRLPISDNEHLASC